MVVEEVEPIGAQAAQTCLQSLRHPVGLPHAALGRALVPELGRDRHLAAARAERAAEVLLGASLAVDVGGVEVRDAGAERGRDHLARGPRIQPPAEVVRAEPGE